MRFRFIIFFLLSLCGTAAADDFQKKHGDFFHVFLKEKDELRFRYTMEKDHAEDGGEAEFDLNSFAFDGDVPVPMTDDFYLRAGTVYSAKVYDFKNTRILDRETVHRAEGVVGLGWFASDDFLVTGITRIGVYSDFDAGLESDDLQVHGELLGAFRFNPGAIVVFGARHSDDFEDSEVLPLVGVRLLSDDGKVYLSLTVPVEARLGYNLSPDVQLYAQAAASGEIYRIDPEDSDERFDLRTHDRRYGIGTDVRLGDLITLTVEGGIAAGSELEFELDNSRDFGGDLDEAGYIIAGFGLTL